MILNGHAIVAIDIKLVLMIRSDTTDTGLHDTTNPKSTSSGVFAASKAEYEWNQMQVFDTFRFNNTKISLIFLIKLCQWSGRRVILIPLLLLVRVLK